jgi:hypothetical protein
MRRIVLAASLLSLVVGLGCKHVAGKCDCYHDPSNAELAPTGNQPYSTLGAPMTGNPVPEKLGQPEKAPAK